MALGSKKLYAIPVSFTFTGKFFIRARSQKEAEKFAEKHCGMVAAGGIYSSLPDEDVGWDFPVHPEKIL